MPKTSAAGRNETGCKPRGQAARQSTRQTARTGQAAPKRRSEPVKPVSFGGLVEAVDLPHPGKGADEAVSLGKLDLDPKLALDVQLLGGDIVAKGNPKFELQKDGGGATPGWSVLMAGKNKDAVKIARVWQEGSEWKIQWTGGRQGQSRAASLLRPAILLRGAEAVSHRLEQAQDRPAAVDRRRYGRRRGPS